MGLHRGTRAIQKRVEQAVNAQLVMKQEEEQGKLRIAKYSVARKPDVR